MKASETLRRAAHILYNAGWGFACDAIVVAHTTTEHPDNMALTKGGQKDPDVYSVYWPGFAHPGYREAHDIVNLFVATFCDGELPAKWDQFLQTPFPNNEKYSEGRVLALCLLADILEQS